MRRIATAAIRTASAALVIAAALPLALQSKASGETRAGNTDDSLGSICGTAWIDKNGDGTRQADESTIANTAIGFFEGHRYTNTDDNGNYCFGDLAAGSYRLQANDRAGWGQGFTVGGHDSKFGFTTGVTEPVVIAKNADGSMTRVKGVDAGYRPATMDLRAVQLLLVVNGRTYASDQQWPPTPFKVGDEFEVYGSAMPDGNVAEQLGATLTLPAGLTILDRAGGMPSTVQGQQVNGLFHERRYPSLVEFVGARVRVAKPFTGQLKLEVPRGVYKDENPKNNVLTAPLRAEAAPETGTPSTPAAGTPDVQANVVNAAATGNLAETGAAPSGLIVAGAALLLAGTGALGFARRRAARRH